MRYKLFGRSGLRVSELALGTMTFGEDWGWGASKEVSRAIFDAFAAAGGNFVDTACNYTNGTSEKYVGEFIASDRDYFVVATKYTLNMRRDDPNAGGNHRKNMVQSVEASLRRLQTEMLDLLWLHMWDGMTPVEEVMRALDDLVRAGKVLYVGISDTPAWVIARANMLADLRGWSPFVALQAPYSLADRSLERELLPMARALDLAVTPWGLLEGGELTGKYSGPAGEPRRSSSADPGNLALGDVVKTVAAEIGRSPSQVAINWVRGQSIYPETLGGNDARQTPIIPILGARNQAQLVDNLGCLDFELSGEHVQRLSAASPIQLGFPRSFLESDHVRGLIFGSTFSLLDNHRQ
jgi:aryl-alcohol dehydrogenase-like predicted oxidoreductase